MDFDLSPRARDLVDRMEAFFADHLLPRNREWRAALDADALDAPFMPDLQDRARAAGLWNLGLPNFPDHGLGNLDFAPLAEIMGRLVWAPQVFNCQPPDLPNMITLDAVADPDQRQRWLEPMMAGGVRTGFAMSEPAVASADARNIALRIDRTSRGYMLNGRKWYVSNGAHPACAFLIVIGAMSEAGPRAGHTAVIVPMDTPGLSVRRRVDFLSWAEPTAPIAEIDFTDVEVPAENRLGAEGEGFGVAQTRLGPARVHHAMRAIGLAEVVVGLMRARAAERQSFNRALQEYDTVQGWIARSRAEIEQARLLVQRCAWMLDHEGHRAAQREVSMVKLIVPEMLQRIADRAIQLFGAMGGSADTPLASVFSWARAFRIFDGPDEVHLRQIYRHEPLPTVALTESPYLYPGAAPLSGAAVSGAK
ncbi:MAG: acyl-CoA dehydrogenase family protein [Pararhodobacter sp.]|nr:acyl-CoA dehydrogenase family protein [Pararhodobacter sp.]